MPAETVEARFQQALDAAIVLQEEIRACHEHLSKGMDEECEARLASLVSRRGPAFEAAGRAAVELALSGRPTALAEEAPSHPEVIKASGPADALDALTVFEPGAEAAPEQEREAANPPVELQAPTEEHEEELSPEPSALFPPPAASESALSALFGKKLGPAWTREGTSDATAHFDGEALDATLKRIGVVPLLHEHNERRAEAKHLDAITGKLDAWRGFPKDLQVKLLEMMTGRLRALQEVAERNSETAMLRRLNIIHHRIRDYTREAQPGIVFGLARDHTSPDGDWSTWASRLYVELQEECCPRESTETRPAAAPSSVKKQDPRNDAPVEDKAPPSDWPYFARTRGIEAVLVGGDIREPARAAIQKAFDFGSLDWIPGGLERRIDSLVESLGNQRVGVVLIIRSLIRHKNADKIIKRCDAMGVRWVLIDTGYGVTQVRLALEKAFEGRRVAGAA